MMLLLAPVLLPPLFVDNLAQPKQAQPNAEDRAAQKKTQNRLVNLAKMKEVDCKESYILQNDKQSSNRKAAGTYGQPQFPEQSPTLAAAAAPHANAESRENDCRQVPKNNDAADAFQNKPKQHCARPGLHIPRILLQAPARAHDNRFPVPSQSIRNQFQAITTILEKKEEKSWQSHSPSILNLEC